MRPMLERIDNTVRNLCCNEKLLKHDGAPLSSEEAAALTVPGFKYSLADLWADFKDNPGGVFAVGGSSFVEEYPVVEPRGTFLPAPGPPVGKVAIVGHSAGGWISRIYLSDRNYGGRA